MQQIFFRKQPLLHSFATIVHKRVQFFKIFYKDLLQYKRLMHRMLSKLLGVSVSLFKFCIFALEICTRQQ